MNFSIVRQTLGQALVMLVVFAVMAVTAGAVGGETLSGDLPYGMAMPLPGVLLRQAEALLPVVSRLVALLLFVAAGLAVGRMTVRYNLYSSPTFMAVSLFAMVACGLSGGDDLLPEMVLTALFAFSCKNFSGSIINGYSFDAIFCGAFYLGLMPLFDAGCAILLPLVPVGLLLFRRTSREAVVALVGVLLPLMTFSYVNWALSGDFRAPMYYILRPFAVGGFFTLIGELPLWRLVLVGSVLSGGVVAASIFVASFFSMSNRARQILIYHIVAALLVVGGLLLPAASDAQTVLLAVTSSVLLPVLFVRLRYWVAAVLYAVLAILSCCNIIL